jgi:large subunit ribosomal protein L22
MMLIKAEQKYVRISPQKMRLVARAVKSLSPDEALDKLKFLNKRSARPLAKVIKQALANAVNNSKLKRENLKFKTIQIGEGAVYKRWRPVSRGRAHSILKRTSHVRVILESKEEIKKEKKAVKEKESKRGSKS